MTTKIITYSFYILFFLTPLFFTPFNSELFEYNKMMLVYFLTIIIVGTWVIKMIRERCLILNRTPLDIPILLFLISQILSTVTSIDPHTSIWGYYSRSNGGLISIISYILLYYALVSNYTFEQAKQSFSTGKKFLKAALLGGLVVSLYAIPEHFGLSPSCVLLQQTFSADCWVQDVQSRVFATLGQPNWLAAYLEMLIFPAIYFALTAKTTFQKTSYLLLVTSYYLAFTFTYSRGATIGLWIGMFVFLLFWGIQRFQNLHFLSFPRRRESKKQQTGWIPDQVRDDKIIIGIVALFILINLIFGSALTGEFRLLKKGAETARPGLISAPSVGTQLENGGTESGQIRLIVWKGALEIFKHYPIFGSGVETFAYSYYQFRPSEHNLVSEWDFLYNKAHNEYLNYLATTGIVGFLSYLLMIGTFLWWSIRRLWSKESGVRSKKDNSELLTLNSALIASYIAYLIQNFFGFSVVIIALFFFVFPAFAFLAADATKPFVMSKRNFLYLFVQDTIFRKPVFQKLAVWVIGVVIVLNLFILSTYWWADKLYKDGQDYIDRGNPGRAYSLLFDAVSLNPNEPLYRADLGNAAAESAISLAEEDATTSGILRDQAIFQTDKATKISPANTSIWRTSLRTYFDLSLVDPKYEQRTLDVFDQTIKLAPTDPKLYYNKALVLESLNRPDEARSNLEKAVHLKPNYLEAITKLGESFQKSNQLEKAKIEYEKALRLTPNDQNILQKLKELATASAKKN